MPQYLDDNGEPQYLDDDGNPIEKPSFLSKALDFAVKPLTNAASTYANQKVAENPHNDVLHQNLNDILPGLGTFVAGAQGFGEGVVQGLGGAIDSLTSPAGLAMTLMGAAEGPALGRAMPNLATVLNYGQKAAAVPFAAHGVQTMINAPTLQEKAQGGFEAAGGLLGLVRTPFSPYKLLGNEPKVAGLLNDKLLDSPVTTVTGPKGKAPLNFNPEEGTFTDPKTGKVFDAAGAIVDNPAERFASQVLPENPQYAANKLAKEARIYRQLMQETGATLEEAKQMRELQRLYPEESTKKLLKYVQENQTSIGGTMENILNEEPPIISEDDPRLIAQAEDWPEYEPQFQRVRPDVTGKNPFTPEALNKVYKSKQEYLNSPEYREQQDYMFRAAKDELDARHQRGEVVDYEAELEQLNKDHGVFDADIKSEQMRVPGTAKNGGLDNIAMGGGSPRVLQVLGSSLYSNDRPSVVTKELLQNSFDEHRIAGVKEPIRILSSDNDKHPITGAKTSSITIRDRGRGLTPDQLYTVFTDVGETGKAGETSASGGFGFAKAAPMLSGEYAEVVSTVNEGKQRVQYTFKGTPRELINQAQGVPLERHVVDKSIPTGLKVKTYFPENTYVYRATELAKNITENSSSTTSDIEHIERYSSPNDEDARWLDYERDANKYRTPNKYSKVPIPTKQATINLPGADINLHYNISKGEHAGYTLNFLNKGLFQGSTYGGYGMTPVPNVPASIFADIISKVEEGHPDYPYSANREQLNTKVTEAINDWVQKNIVQGAEQHRIAMLQRAYDEMEPLFTWPNSITHMVDQGKRFTDNELRVLKNSQALKYAMGTIDEVNRDLVKFVDAAGLPWKKTPSQRLRKFGLLFAAPDANNGSTTLGIHIPNPGNLNESAILINVFEHLNTAFATNDPLDRIASGLWGTMTHELAHVPGGGHDTGFAYRHADLLEKLGRRNTNNLMDALYNAFEDPNNAGTVNPEVYELLQIYNDSRQRTASVDDPLLGTGVNQKRPANSSRGKRSDDKRSNHGPAVVDRRKSNAIEALNLPRALQASMDLSAPLRQGRAFVHKKQYWNAFASMYRSLGSETAFRATQAAIESHPLYKYALDKGLSFTDLTNLSMREENIMSSWAENAGMSANPAAKAYRHTIGRGVRASNRAYTSFLNKLRMDVFADIVEKNNLLQKDSKIAETVADFVNNATGRGSLGRFEKIATELNTVFFAPRNTMSQIRMLNVFNPNHYIYANPIVRQEAIKSLAAIFGTTMVIGQLLKMSGMAKVSLDPTNADFMKVKIGKTRLDFNGGYGQYVVAFSRMVNSMAGDGKFTSSKNGKQYNTNVVNELGRVARNKEAPIVSFAHSMATGKTPTGQKFQVAPQTMQLFVPMLVQDMVEVAKKQPALLPFIAPLASHGVGVQTY